MKVVVKKSALDQIIKQLAEDRSYHSARIDQIAGEGQPVLPDAQMATQLSASRVPVEDPDFLPVNTQQLSAAASEIAEKVPQDKVQKFYVALLRLLKSTTPPAQYKGMSETDLMEVLRPFVMQEAMDLPSFSGEEKRSRAQKQLDRQRRLAAQSGIEFGDEPEEEEETMSTSVVDAGEDDDEGKTVDTGIRVGQTRDRSERQKSPQKKKPKKIDVLTTDAENLTPAQQLQKLLYDSEKSLNAIQNKFISNQIKLPLSRLVVGDVNRFLDAFKEAKLRRPESLEDAKVEIQIENQDSIKPRNFDLPIQRRVVRFIDKEKRPGLVLDPITHDGGALEAVAEYADGRKEAKIYYITQNFPFNLQEYLEEFERILPIEAKRRQDEHEKALKTLLAPKEEPEEEKASKGGKEISADEKEMAVDLVIDAIFGDPKSFDKMFKDGDPGMTRAEFDSLSSDDPRRAAAIENIAMNYWIKTRKLGTATTRTRFGLGLDRPEAEDAYDFIGKKGTPISSDPATNLREALVDDFYGNYIVPIASNIIKKFAEDLASKGSDGKINIGGKSYPVSRRTISQITTAFGIIDPESFERDEEDLDFDMDEEIEMPSVELEQFLDEIKVDNALFESLLKTQALVSRDYIKSNIEEFKLIPMYHTLITQSPDNTKQEFGPYLAQVGAEDKSRLADMYVDFKEVQLIARGVIVAAQIDQLNKNESEKSGKKKKARSPEEIFKALFKNPEQRENILSNYKSELGISNKSDFSEWFDKTADEAWEIVGDKFSQMIQKDEDTLNSPEMYQNINEYANTFKEILSDAYTEDAAQPGFEPDSDTKKFLENMFKIAAVEADEQLEKIGFDYSAFSSAIISFMSGKDYSKAFKKEKTKK